jgi:hypothetical protein
VEVGDREWRAADCKLTVLEGEALDTAELALGQGWSNAIKVAEDVTARLLAEGPAVAAADRVSVAVLADTPRAANAVASLLRDLGLLPTAWEPLRPGAGDSDVTAAVVALEGPLTAAVGLAAGVALGALGDAAIVVRLGAEPVPAELESVAAIRAQPAEQEWIHALAERLRGAGCTLRPRPGWDAPHRFAGL